jgi:HlyD family secretion protein
MTESIAQPQQKPPVLVLLDLARRARHAESAASLQFILTNETYALSPYQVAAFWVKEEGVISQSSVSQLDRNSPFILWLSRVCKSLSSQEKPVVVTPAMIEEEDVPEWNESLPGQALWLPIGKENLSAGLLLCREDPWQEQDIGLLTEWVDIWVHAWIKLHAPTIHGELSKWWVKFLSLLPTEVEAKKYFADLSLGVDELVNQFVKKPSTWPGLMKKAFQYLGEKVGCCLGFLKKRGFHGTLESLELEIKEIWKDKKRRIKWLVWIAILFPVRLTILAPAELVPANPAIIRVPIEGVVDEFFVTPNQKVVEGQPLFKLDLTSLNSRLQVAQQEMQIASTEYRQSALQSLSDSKSRGLLVPQEGKATEKRLEADYLKDLLAKAQIKAPRGGVALFDEPSEWIGKPVVAGEKIMVIANENQAEIEAWIPLNEAIELPEGAAVTLYLNASPLSPIDAKMRYLGHEAMQRPDGTYAYRLRASIDAGESPARIGLKGTARVSGQFVPLSYWVLRKPIASVRQYLGL